MLIKLPLKMVQYKYTASISEGILKLESMDPLWLRERDLGGPRIDFRIRSPERWHL